MKIAAFAVGAYTLCAFTFSAVVWYGQFHGNDTARLIGYGCTPFPEQVMYAQAEDDFPASGCAMIERNPEYKGE
jgi:hypothetical protein